MGRSIPIPLIGLVGLLLAIDGMVSWLAGATIWSWGPVWCVGTGVLLTAFLMRLQMPWQKSVGIAGAVAVSLAVVTILLGETISALALDDVPTIVGFLLIFVGEIGIGIATMLSGRASAEGANLWVYLVAGLAVVVLVNYVAARHLSQRIDLTENRLESLSDQTVAKLSALRQDVRVMGFFRDNDPQRDYYAQMLKKYADVSSYFSFEFVDPDKYPDVARGEAVNPRGISIVVKCEGRREMLSGMAEKDLTSALIKVTRAGKKTIYFSTWHEERSLEEELRAVKSRLDALNYGVETFRLDQDDIPGDCAVFVMAGPKTPLLSIEADRLERYLGQGNKLLVMLDPDTVAFGLEDVLAKYGAIVRPNLLMERKRGLVPYAGGYYMGEEQSSYLSAARYSEHPVIEDLAERGMRTGFHLAREVVWAKPNTDINPRGNEFVFAGTDISFATGDVGKVLMNPRDAVSAEGSPSGPFCVGVAASADAIDPLTPKDVDTRLVVFGDSDFATDRAIGNERGNLTLIVNALTWLAEDEDLIAIQPREAGEKPLSLMQGQGVFISLLSVWRYPALVLVAGLLIWWYRRNRGPGSETV